MPYDNRPESLKIIETSNWCYYCMKRKPASYKLVVATTKIKGFMQGYALKIPVCDEHR